MLLGLSTYLYLPIASATNPPVNWAYSRTLEGFLHLLSRGQYEHVRAVNSVAVFAPELLRFITQTGREFGWFYLPFATLPFCFVLRMAEPARKWLAATLLISLCVGPLLAALLNAPSDLQSQGMIESYFFPFRVPLALWTGLGLTLFAAKIATLGQDASPQPSRVR
jgi:hypothetical protein